MKQIQKEVKIMKVIDLLNKIANGEEVPKNIKYYNDYILTYDEDTQDYYNEPSCTYSLLNDIHYKLTDEIEIIEDIPKKDKIKELSDYQMCQENYYKIIDKINEIIDRLNGADNVD
jgi:uncharacterized protein (UPF0147 family)